MFSRIVRAAIKITPNGKDALAEYANRLMVAHHSGFKGKVSPPLRMEELERAGYLKGLEITPEGWAYLRKHYKPNLATKGQALFEEVAKLSR